MARTMFTIVEGMLHPSASECLFGPMSARRPPYVEILIPWMRKRRVLMNADFTTSPDVQLRTLLAESTTLNKMDF